MPWTVTFTEHDDKPGIGQITFTWTEPGKPDFVYSEPRDNLLMADGVTPRTPPNTYRTFLNNRKNAFYTRYDRMQSIKASLETWVNS